MSSLQSIMNLDDDQQDASSPMDKKDKDATAPSSGFRDNNPSSSTSTGQSIHPSRQHFASLNYISPPSQQQNLPDVASASTTQQGKRPAETSAATSILPTASLRYDDTRRQSSTSVDSMDHHGYGSAASSSSMGGGPGSGGYPPNVPRRPMGSSPGPEVPVRLTPITGRVSRAKKGVPVHICDQCNPPKTFTRAEHLRRHQLSHQKPQYPCSFPGCGRTFYRQDLLSRHELRHTQEGGDPSSPRFSDAPATPEEQISRLRVGNPSLPVSYSPAPGSVSNTRPSTPPTGGGTRSIMSPQPEGHDQYGLSPGHLPSSQTGYALHTGIPAIAHTTSSLEPSPEPSLIDRAPRIMSFFGVSQSLSPPAGLQTLVDLPDLIDSCESDTGYSTPSEVPRIQHYGQTTVGWAASNPLLPAAFPMPDRREVGMGGDVGLMAPPYYMAPSFSVSPHLSSATTPSYGPLFNEPLMTGFAEEEIQLLDPAITGHHGIHSGSPSVRSSSPSISISVSGQAADTLVTPAPLHRIEPMVRVSRQKELAIGGGTTDMAMGVLGSEGRGSIWTGDNSGAPGMPAGQGLTGLHGGSLGRVPALARPSGAILNAVPSYIEIYWKHMHRSLPIVHRPSFEVASEEALRCAMAAMATQHLNSKEDRIRGSQLHEYAWQEAKRCAPGNLQGMQALLLCEYFARFRGRRALARPSKTFESLYSRVIDQSLNLFNATMDMNAANLTHQQHQKTQLAASREQRWRNWLDAEASRRLVAACFCLDHHAATYHQQPRAKNDIDLSNIPLTGQTDSLWEAGSIEEWYAILEAEPTAATPQYLPRLDAMTPEDITKYSRLDQGIMLCAYFLELENQRRAASSSMGSSNHSEHDVSSAEDLRTPTAASYAAVLFKVDNYDRAATVFSKSLVAPIADMYVALQHTPLHDLLAVSGDSWVFSQKVLEPTAFAEHQKRLRAWAEGRSTSFSSANTSPTTGMQQQQQQQQPTSPITMGLEGLSSAKATIYAARTLVSLLDGLHCQGSRPYVGCISTYWAIYVCALIIWAYGHSRNISKASSGGGGGTTSSSSSSGSPNKGTPMTEEETISWLRIAADVGQPEHLARVRGRREASAGVVSLVKRMLEADCVGGRSRLYVDATVVMRKLEEGLNFRWF